MTQIQKYTKKDGSTAYKFHVYVGTNQKTGKKVYKKRQGFPTKKKAQIALAELLKDIEENGLEEEKEGKIQTFKQLFELWLSQQRFDVKESTLLDQERFAKNHILPMIGDIKLSELTVLTCQKLVNNAYSSDLKRYNYVRSLTAQILRYGESIEVVKDNPMRKTVLPRKKATEEKLKYFTKEELTLFFNLLKGFGNYQMFACFRLLAFTGARKSEIMALQWKDINFKKNELTVSKTVALSGSNQVIIQTPKTTSSNRTISLDPETMKILTRWRTLQRSDYFQMGHITTSEEQYLFTDRNNELHKMAIPNQWLARILEGSTLPRITPHHFRHTHASLLLQAGVPVKEVSERLGHKDITITLEIYSHVMPEEKEKTASKFANFVGF